MPIYPQINQQITFFYTHNLNASTEFYEQKLGLELWLDQGACRIYTVSGSGYLGLCQASEISTPLADKQSSVIFTLVTQQVDEWFEYLKERGVGFEKPPTLNEKYNIYHCFFRDPSGYLIEIQRFETTSKKDITSFKERGFESYSPSLIGKGLGVRSVLHSTDNRYK